jgi:calcineurin-like phosphoesterase family protein
VLALGDMQYQHGELANFHSYYDPTWGRVWSATKPVPGNHEYRTPNATGYYRYFGPRAGDPKKGYYSYDLDTWHFIALNSNCSAVGGCGLGDPQGQWLLADLRDHPSECTLAYWHHPRFSSGTRHGSDPGYQPFWQALYQAVADVVLNGHEHNYERFAPQNPSGTPDPAGITQFVVGTGGKSHYPFSKTPLATSRFRNSTSFGVLKLTLHPTSYDWEFVTDSGASIDRGSASCVSGRLR